MKNNWNWEIIADHSSLTEGPVWTGKGLLFNECSASITYYWDAKTGKSQIWRSNTGQSNGMVFDRNGSLYVCEGSNHRVVKVDINSPDREPVVMSNNDDNKQFNMPNDIAVDANGRIYFSDPNYSDSPNNRKNESVYLIEPSFGGNQQTHQVTFDTNKPNGVLLSIDQKFLYVAESPQDPKLRRELRAYPILSNGILDDYEVLHDFGQGRGIDGMSLTTTGTIIATAGSLTDSDYGTGFAGPGPMIYEFEHSGRVIMTYPCPSDSPTNCTFGGPKLETLFVTCGTGKVYKIDDTGHTGQLAFPIKSIQ